MVKFILVLSLLIIIIKTITIKTGLTNHTHTHILHNHSHIHTHTLHNKKTVFYFNSAGMISAAKLSIGEEMSSNIASEIRKGTNISYFYFFLKRNIVNYQVKVQPYTFDQHILHLYWCSYMA